jgi:hypothetical protein
MRFVSKAVLASTLIAMLPAAALAAIYYHPMFDTKKGGSVCYARTYSAAFLKKHPDVKLTTISLERRNSISDVTPNSKKFVGIKFGASTKNDVYEALADCKPQGSVLKCQVEADGGSFTIQKAGKGAIIKTRRISVEGTFKDLEIQSKKGKAARSFTLRGYGKEDCNAAFD